MTLEDYPEDATIVETNFKTDQQADAAEKIEDEWPVDLDRLAEEGQHVKMFYKQVLDQFLGPAAADATFAELKDEYGSLEQWAEADSADETNDEEAAVDVPDVEDIDPDGDESDGVATSNETAAAEQAAEEAVSIDASAAADIDAGAAADVDERRRAWFRAGFREGVEFALENPELFER